MQDQPDLQVCKSIFFGDFNLDNQCMGYGLQSYQKIDQGDDILRMKTSMAIVSDSLIDSSFVEEKKTSEGFSAEQDDQLLQDLTKNTRKVAKMI